MTARLGATRHMLLVTAAMLLPLLVFMNKPYHVDDAVFLDTADRLPWTLLGGTPAPVTFDGRLFPALSPYESTHPPLIPYLLKLIGTLHDPHTHPFLLYHLVFLLFPLGAAAAGFSLCRDLGGRCLPLWFLVTAPAFCVIAGTLMTDVALTAFWMGAVALTVRLDRRPSIASAVGCFLCTLAAMGTAYQAAALPFLLAAYALWRKRALCLWAPAAALAVFGVYLGIVYAQSGVFPLLAHTVDLNIAGLVDMGRRGGNPAHKLTAAAVQLGFNLLPALPWAASAYSPSRRTRTAVLTLLLSCLWFEVIGRQPWMGAYEPGHLFVLRLLFAAGLYWLLLPAADLTRCLRLREIAGVEDAAARLCLIWFYGVVGYCVLLMPYINARYILPALPAALLVVGARRHETGRSFKIGAVLALLLGLACAGLDHARAQADAALFGEMRVRVTEPDRLYYTSDHGLDRYLSVWGARYLTSDTVGLPAGSLVLWTGKAIDPRLASRLREVARFAYPAPAGFTLYGPGSGGGFYCSHEGMLPVGRASLMTEAILFEVGP